MRENACLRDAGSDCDFTFETPGQMVIDHADRLHVGVADHGPDK